MKLSDFTILFASLFFCFFIVFSYNVSLATAAAHEDMDYGQMLTAACYDAVEDISVYDTNSAVLTLNKAENIITAYFDTLKVNMAVFGDPNNAEQVSLYSPAVCVIDNDGFYINYLTTYTDSNGTICYKRVTTPKQGWAISYGDYTVIVSLGSYVEVVNKRTGEIYKGHYSDVYDKTGIYFLNDNFTYAGSIHSSFQEYKTIHIINDITDKLSYYVSNHNYIASSYHLNYTFELPAISTSSWSQMLAGPTVIGFLQGIPINQADTYINIYSFAGSFITKGHPYCISGELYHKDDCELVMLYGYDSEHNSAEECAYLGAYPCHVCNP